jgi:hypothetical protein
MKPWISALVGMVAMLIIWMPRPAVAAEPMTTFQPGVVAVHYWANDPYHHHYQHRPWYGVCRDPRFRRHHPFLCR